MNVTMLDLTSSRVRDFFENYLLGVVCLALVVSRLFFLLVLEQLAFQCDLSELSFTNNAVYDEI